NEVEASFPHPTSSSSLLIAVKGLLGKTSVTSRINTLTYSELINSLGQHSRSWRRGVVLSIPMSVETTGILWRRPTSPAGRQAGVDQASTLLCPCPSVQARQQKPAQAQPSRAYSPMPVIAATMRHPITSSGSIRQARSARLTPQPRKKQRPPFNG